MEILLLLMFLRMLNLKTWCNGLVRQADVGKSARDSARAGACRSDDLVMVKSVTIEMVIEGEKLIIRRER